MKKTTFLMIAFLTLATVTANAKVWRVSNRANEDQDFSTLQDAINGASAGDTLYVAGSPFSYGSGTFTKRLTVIGTGYWLNENDTTQAYKEKSWVQQLVFNVGSKGSVISGLYVYYGNYGSQQNWKLISINTDSIVIQRNFIYGFASENSTYTGFSIYVDGNKSGIIIQQNWIIAQLADYYGNSANGTVYGIYFSGVPTECIVQNNFVRSYLSHNYGTCYSIALNNNALNDLKVAGNVIWGTISTYYTNHFNNILVSGSYNYGIGDEPFNNLGSSTQYPAGNGNQQNVNMDSVFVDYDLYIDKGYLLKPNSPAKNAGIDGGDCGAFGNDFGYKPCVLSGIPAIPAIFEVNTQMYGEETIPVNIKAKSNN